MKLPDIPKDQLPEEIQEKIEGDTAEFEPLGSSEEAMRHVRQKKSESEMRRTLGELESLNKLFKKRKELGQREFVRKVKKNQKFYRSNLFHIKNINEGQESGQIDNKESKETS